MHMLHRVIFRGAGGAFSPSWIPLEFGIQKKTLNFGLRMHRNASQRINFSKFPRGACPWTPLAMAAHHIPTLHGAPPKILNRPLCPPLAKTSGWNTGTCNVCVPFVWAIQLTWTSLFPWKMKKKSCSGVIQTHDILLTRQMLNQLSYQVRISSNRGAGLYFLPGPFWPGL